MRGKKGKTILMPKFAHGKKELACGHFSQEKVVMVVARVIIMHEYPLSIVDHVGFSRH